MKQGQTVHCPILYRFMLQKRDKIISQSKVVSAKTKVYTKVLYVFPLCTFNYLLQLLFVVILQCTKKGVSYVSLF